MSDSVGHWRAPTYFNLAEVTATAAVDQSFVEAAINAVMSEFSYSGGISLGGPQGAVIEQTLARSIIDRARRFAAAPAAS